MRVLVLGVGNTLRGDDGVGYCVARALAECGGVRGARVEFVQRLNPGHFALLEGFDVVVFIDALVDPDMPPGARVGVVELEPSRLSPEDVAAIVQATDPHGMDPLRLAVMAYAAGFFKGKAVIVGVKPLRIEFMEGLSGEVLEAIPKLLRELGSVLGRLGAGPLPDTACIVDWVKRRCSGPVLD